MIRCRWLILAWGISLAAHDAWAEDPALTAPPVDTAPGDEYADSARKFQGIPGIERSPGGRLWAVWYGGGTGEGEENYVMLVTSGDDGQTWSPLKLVIDPPGPVRAYDPCLWCDPRGRLWVFWAQSFQWWDGRSGTWAITTAEPDDENPTWSAPRRLCDGIMMNKPTVTRDGAWLLPVAIWERPARVSGIGQQYAHDLESLRGGNIVVSRDGGQTFQLLGQTRVPERVFDEHMIVQRQDGSLWTLVRTSYGIGQSVSTDGGRTWTAGEPSGLPHVNSRFFIRRLASGKLLLVTHRPADGKTRSHLMAHLSDDDGRTWQGGLLIDERAGVSYPDGVEAPDGTVYLIYDYQRTADKQILMATFTAADVAAGEEVSGRVRRRVVVNQATGKRGS